MVASPATKNTLDLTEVVIVKYWTLHELRVNRVNGVNRVMLLFSNFNYKFESKRVNRLSRSTPQYSRIKTQISVS